MTKARKRKKRESSDQFIMERLRSQSVRLDEIERMVSLLLTNNSMATQPVTVEEAIGALVGASFEVRSRGILMRCYITNAARQSRTQLHGITIEAVVSGMPQRV